MIFSLDTTEAIFIVRRIQGGYTRKNHNLLFAFVNLEKAFDRILRRVLRWVLQKKCLQECVVCVRCMHQNVAKQLRINNVFSDVQVFNAFNVQVLC